MAQVILRGELQRRTALDLIGKLDLSKTWCVKVEPHKETRSSNQSALYWKWVGLIADETGNDKDDLHEIFKLKFLDPTEVSMGSETVLVRSTKKLDPKEMSAFMNRVEAFANSQLGILLPHLGES